MLWFLKCFKVSPLNDNEFIETSIIIWFFFLLKIVGGYIVFLGLISIFVVVYLVCFYMWLRRKVANYSDVDNIIIIIVFFWFKV